MPLSDGYDFIGDLPKRSRRTGRLIRESKVESIKEEKFIELPKEGNTEDETITESVETEEIKGEPTVEDSIVEEKIKEEPIEEPIVKEPTEEKPIVIPETEVKEIVDKPSLPESNVVIEEVVSKPITYVELDYESINRSNPMSSFPVSENGNYIVIYSTDSCVYCDKLKSELKDKTEAYIIVVIHCRGAVRDLYYNRTIYYFPSWLIMSNSRVTYYGVGYYNWESFRRMLK